MSKDFLTAFRQRRSRVEATLTANGLAAFGKPLLASVGRSLQWYSNGKDLKTGRRRMCAFRDVSIGTSGAVKSGRDGFYKEAVPAALVELGPEEGGLFECEGVSIELRGRAGALERATLDLWGPIPDTPHRNGGATLRITLPNPLESLAQASQYLGAFYLIARLAAEGPTCLENPDAARVTTAAPVSPETTEGGPAGPPLPQFGAPVPPRQAAAANMGYRSRAFEAVNRRPPRGEAARRVRRASVRLNPVDNGHHVPVDLVDQAIVTALKVILALNVPCCEVHLEPNSPLYAKSVLYLQACEGRYCCLQLKRSLLHMRSG